MNKILSTMCALLFAAQFNLLSAQTTVMKVWKKVIAAIPTEEIDSITFEPTDGKNLGDGFYLINGHKFIDLGLPSGLLWAETNVGAETAADDGNYYAWGETTTKDTYNWDTYRYGTSYNNMTKYNKTDSLTILDKEDDAAYANWGAPCRMPTDGDFSELQANCVKIWTYMTTSSGGCVEGYKFISRKNCNSIFFPASGSRGESNLIGHGSYGCYWSSTLSSYCTSYAYGLDFNSGYFYSDSYYRFYGRTVRPVAEK